MNESVSVYMSCKNRTGKLGRRKTVSAEKGMSKQLKKVTLCVYVYRERERKSIE